LQQSAAVKTVLVGELLFTSITSVSPPTFCCAAHRTPNHAQLQIKLLAKAYGTNVALSLIRLDDMQGVRERIRHELSTACSFTLALHGATPTLHAANTPRICTKKLQIA
jgi:hypothetical protein